MRLKSVSYSEIGSNWPSQNIHPAGAKLPPNMRISPTYGCAISSFLSLRLAREDALQRDAEVQHEERLHVQVSLVAADVGDGRGVHRRQVVVGRLIKMGRSAGELITGGDDQIAVDRGGVEGVGMRRNLGD